jgi:outer membrane immunogenic protein
VIGAPVPQGLWGRDSGGRFPGDVAVLQQPDAFLPYTIAGSVVDGMGAFDMRKLLPGSMAFIALGLSIPAMAADLEVGAPTYKATRPVMRAYDWTGIYVGGNVGGHWGSDKITTLTDPGGGFGVAGADAIDGFSGTTLHPSGFIGGVEAGYNLEGSGGVFGIEVDANWLGGSATRTLSNIPVIGPLDVMTNTAQATFLWTARLRWGTTVLSDRALLFLTAGFAVETLKTTDTMGHFANTVITGTSNTTTEPGVTAGAGFEYAITNNVSAKFEYLFVSIKNVGTTIPSSAAGNPDSIAVTHNYIDNIGRFGLNYKFGG